MMSLFDLRKTVIAVAIGLMVVIVGSENASAQSRRDTERERQRIERENNARYERDRQRQYQRDRSNDYRGTSQRITNINFANGYQYGYQAGANDRRKGKYNRSNVYRNTPSAPYQGDPSSVDYIYRQGYLAGYEDGFYGRQNY